MERLIVCQGTAQLVTAVSALRKHAKITCMESCRQTSRDHLLICGLAVAEKQIYPFVQVIESMAALLHSFSSVNRLDDTAIKRLTDMMKRDISSQEIASQIQSITGLGAIDEVFTVRDWQACNEIALAAYPEATHVCYGDSVGVYLPKGFMAPKPSPWSGILTQFLSLFSLPSKHDNPRVDISYLLLPELFGKPPKGTVIQTDLVILRKLFLNLAPLLDRSKMDDIRRKTKGRTVWVLLGSNFSEQGLMTPEGEAFAYRDWIRGMNPEPGTVLLIKSHPRDNRGKLELLNKHLESLFEEVWSIDSLGSPYMPIETILLDLRSIVREMRCLTVSTACLGTHYVVESKTEVGLGENLVSKYIVENMQKQRIQHEQILRKLCLVKN